MSDSGGQAILLAVAREPFGKLSRAHRVFKTPRGGVGSGESIESFGVLEVLKLAGPLGQFNGLRRVAQLVARNGYQQPRQVVECRRPIWAKLDRLLETGLVRRFAESAVLVYDGDEAGAKAAERGVTVLAQVGIDPRVVLLPQGKDPDDYVRARGCEAFRDLICEAADMLEFVLRDVADATVLSPGKKSAVARRAFAVIGAIGDSIKQSEYLHLLSEIKLCLQKMIDF